jgi:hypothetical protein
MLGYLLYKERSGSFTDDVSRLYLRARLLRCQVLSMARRQYRLRKVHYTLMASFICLGEWSFSLLLGV